MRRSAPLFLVLVMLLPQVALASAWYQCRHDRVVRHSCCCPAGSRERAPESRPPGPELRRASCCDILTRQTREGVARAELAPSSRVRGPLLLAILAPRPPGDAPSLGIASPAPALRATAPPAPPDPIYLRNASLLL
ncbi:MAG TPA: hypothetical protein VKB80_37050 [Kofleriaceae bacterium]|nr:hypothetical protein [Kofleriaceae bacterium]